MSAFYHICPTNANFQFGKSFTLTSSHPPFHYGGLFVSKLSIQNAVFAPTNCNYIDSMVNKFDSICTTFDSIIRGGVHVHQFNFMKIELIRATFDSII